MQINLLISVAEALDLINNIFIVIPSSKTVVFRFLPLIYNITVLYRYFLSLIPVFSMESLLQGPWEACFVCTSWMIFRDASFMRIGQRNKTQNEFFSLLWNTFFAGLDSRICCVEAYSLRGRKINLRVTWVSAAERGLYNE